MGPLGFAPIASGTFGSLAGVALVLLFRFPAPLYVLLTTVLCIAGVYASGYVETVTGRTDPGCIVIDEVAGYLISMAFLPVTFGYLLSAFILFRILDILKPLFIHRLQSLKGGLGVMADDVLAGIYTNLILQAWKTLAT